MQDFIRQSDAEFGDWMPWAVAELNLELDAMSVRLDIRRSLARRGMPEQLVEARVLDQTIVQIRWAQQIDWRSILGYLASTRRESAALPCMRERRRSLPGTLASRAKQHLRVDVRRRDWGR
jgi:hypothetical protein